MVSSDWASQAHNQQGYSAAQLKVVSQEIAQHLQTGGKHVKTARKHKCKDGVTRVLYKKGDSFFVKKKSQKTGKISFCKVKA